MAIFFFFVNLKYPKKKPHDVNNPCVDYILKNIRKKFTRRYVLYIIKPEKIR